MNPNQPNPGQQPLPPTTSGPTTPAPLQQQNMPSQLPNNGFPPGHNPYEFITANSPANRKAPLLGGASPFKQRLTIILGGGMLAMILVVVVVKLLGSAGSANVSTLKNLQAEQQEIIRVATIGTLQAQDSTALNLATTAQQSVQTEQLKLTTYLISKKVKTTPLELARKKNTSNDTVLTQAAQDNNFDSVFIVTMVKLLNTYQSDTSKAYDTASNETSKTILKSGYVSTKLMATYYGTAATTPAL